MVEFDFDDTNFELTNLPENIQTLTWTINKAVYDMSGVTFENATVTYDGNEQSLAIEGDLPDGVTLSYSANSQTNAGTYTVTAMFTGDADNYEIIPDVTATLTINKATPVYTLPKNLTATEGQTLADITLPDGWSWQDDSMSVGEEGERSFAAAYTPSDTANYNTVTVDLTVNVLASGLSAGTIIAIVLGCILGALIIAYGVGALLYKKGKIKEAFFGKIYPFIKL